MPAINLVVAANNAYNNLTVWYDGADTLKVHLTGFWQALIKTPDVFPDSNASSRPIADWLTVIAALTASMPDADIPLSQFEAAVFDVYRVCWLGDFLYIQGLLTSDQRDALLGSYNTFISAT